MTEAEAKTKWCPMVRVFDGWRTNREEVYVNGTHCIGSDCMMWRWRVGDNSTPIPKHFPEAGGYCGLANKP